MNSYLLHMHMYKEYNMNAFQKEKDDPFKNAYIYIFRLLLFNFGAVFLDMS